MRLNARTSGVSIAVSRFMKNDSIHDCVAHSTSADNYISLLCSHDIGQSPRIHQLQQCHPKNPSAYCKPSFRMPPRIVLTTSSNSCASSPGNKAVYEQSATSVGQALASNGNQCVYGGGVRGLMGTSSPLLYIRHLLIKAPGTVSASCLEAGGRAHGIIPSALTGRAAEIAVREARSGSQTPVSDEGRSKEGSGETVVKGTEEDYGGRYTNEIVKTMHEVCS
jgi:hypothetical protein